GQVPLAALEVHHAVEALGPAALVAHGDPSGVVAAAMALQTLGEGFDRPAFPQLRTVDQNQPALARRRRLIRLECHDYCLPFASGPIGPGYRAPKLPGGTRVRIFVENPLPG